MRPYGLILAAGMVLVGSAAIAQDGQPVSTGQGVSENPAENNNRRARDAASDATFANQVEKAARASRQRGNQARPAKAEEVTAGAIVKDSAGQQIATIEGVEVDGVVLVNSAGKVKVPLEAFGLNNNGLLLDVTKTQFDQLVASAVGPEKS